MKAFALIILSEIPQHCVAIIGSYPAGLLEEVKGK